MAGSAMTDEHSDFCGGVVMENLTITQEYYICVANDKGTISVYDHKAATCLIAAGVLDMSLENCVGIDGKTVEVTGKLPDNIAFLRPLYDTIDQGKAIKLSKVVESYIASFSDKKLKELIGSVVTSLEGAGVMESVKTGIFKSKEGRAPSQASVNGVVEKIRAEILEDGEMSDEAVALAALLDRAGKLKDYFSKYEHKELRARLTDIKKSEAGKSVKEMADYIDGLMASMLAVVTTTTGA